MSLITRVKNYLNRKFRVHYENRISLRFGIQRFIGNVAFIQLTHEEYIPLFQLDRVADLWVTARGMRPLLNYSVFLDDWKMVQVIVEARGFQINQETPESEKNRKTIIEENSKALSIEAMKKVPWPEFNQETWETVGFEDPRLEPLKDLFLGCAFYLPLCAEHKRKLSEKIV